MKFVPFVILVILSMICGGVIASYIYDTESIYLTKETMVSKLSERILPVKEIPSFKITLSDIDLDLTRGPITAELEFEITRRCTSSQVQEKVVVDCAGMIETLSNPINVLALVEGNMSYDDYKIYFEPHMTYNMGSIKYIYDIEDRILFKDTMNLSLEGMILNYFKLHPVHEMEKSFAVTEIRSVKINEDSIIIGLNLIQIIFPFITWLLSMLGIVFIYTLLDRKFKFT